MYQAKRLRDGTDGAWSDLYVLIETIERKKRFPRVVDFVKWLKEPNKKLVEQVFGLSRRVAFACYLITAMLEYRGGE